MDHNISESDLEQLRRELNHGTGKSQKELTQIATLFASAHTKLRPRDKKEPLPLFTDEGVATGTTAPRWLCHVLGLRHRCAHILLVWKSTALGELLLLQIRAWGKDDSPGHLDISVGGHMTVDETSEAQQTAFAEMLQELQQFPLMVSSLLTSASTERTLGGFTRSVGQVQRLPRSEMTRWLVAYGIMA